MIYAIAVLCVVGIAAGQILFKTSAQAFEQAGTYLDTRGAIVLLIALVLYGVTTLAWVWVLQKLPLGRVYPLMALAFVMVPIGSHFVFGERFQLQYFIGVLLIMIGIVVSVRS